MSSADPPKPSKRKWDQPAPGEDGNTPKAKAEDSRTASEAAAAAAAIAAKIAAQFASGAFGGDKDHDAEFTHDIDINDVRNRYMLTKGSTQEQVCNLFSLYFSGRLGAEKLTVSGFRFMRKLELR